MKRLLNLSSKIYDDGLLITENTSKNGWMLGWIACESFSYELFDYIQIQIDEEIQRIVLKVGWKMEWDSVKNIL